MGFVQAALDGQPPAPLKCDDLIQLEEKKRAAWSVWPYGLCKLLVPAGAEPPPDAWIASSRRALAFSDEGWGSVLEHHFEDALRF